ncbi:helix-turn-helix domain-containing protein [Streptomyces sp. NBC_00328]|uniref:helix-turn-helix domain-containing protein n=1 Tax=Streptomyces sp. NBC_00328 TaxID=2903646 RepID=UPI002E2AAD37|nr:helix-turn-helix domain-containing protein [Streptomyces sp. NBC_00328]
MGTQNFSAPPCAQPRIPRGVTHINVRHATRYTVVGNHLAQHRELSLTAIGLAVHIQSLPEGARVDIKSLATRFQEGETRIAASLRELESHGYLSRRRERLPSGRVVTHTVSYNQPQGLAAPTARPTAPEPGPPPGAPRKPERERAAVPPAAGLPPAPAPPTAAAAAAPAPAPAPAPMPKRPLPTPGTHDPYRHLTATVLLASLHREDPRLLLSERDVNRLAPAVSAWLERGVAPEAVRATLTSGLPREPLRHPAGVMSHRLTESLPPRTPTVPVTARPHPLQNCDGCDRAFRAPEPGRCARCRHRSDLPEAA